MEDIRPVFRNIWLADDDEDDQFVFEDVVKGLLPAVKLRMFSDCNALITELNVSTPSLLFLDINMPCISGSACLKIIRDNNALLKLPIVIYSSSAYEKDIIRSYRYGANLYLIKPPTYQKLVRTFHAVLLLDWENPSGITSSHYVNNRFVPFSVG